MRRTRLARTTTALALAALPLTGGSAGATDVVTFSATASVWPGVPIAGCAHVEWTLSTTAAIFWGDHTGTHSLSFVGNSANCATFDIEYGSGTVSGVLAGEFSYLRTDTRMRIQGAGSGMAFDFTCVFVPTSASPISSYFVSCAGVVLDGPS